MKRLIALCALLALLLSGCVLFFPPTPIPILTQPPGSSDKLTVHYIDVGQADCALVECGGEFLLIDGGNVGDSSLVVSYLQKAGVKQLSAVVCSHAHEDHAGGLAGVLAVFPTAAVYAPTKTYSSSCFDDFLYYADQQRLSVTIPSAGDSFSLGTAQVHVLGPVKSYAETNDTSIVLRIDFGQNRFLFTGDMEVLAENDMLDAGADVKVDVLKVGHHGSNTSTGYRFLYEAAPKYGVISVGAGNDYGHPHKEPLSRLRDAGVTLYRTDKMGTVVAVSDGKEITFSWEHASAQPEIPEEIVTHYIGNKNSHVLHHPNCSGLPNEKNRVYFETVGEALDAGYDLCSQCMK